MPSLTEIMVSIRVDDSELGKLDQAGQKIDAMGQRGESVGRSMQTVGLGMAAVGAAGGAMFGAALMGAADFEQSMDFVGAALGGVGTASGVTEAQFAALSQQALDLGSSTQYSANQVAAVQEELGKSGVAAESLLSGATDAVLSLSAATGEDLVTSAQVAAGAMNTFGLGGEKMGYVADVVTGALNNSSMSLKDFNTGMNYLGPTLAQTGGDFDDAAAAIAYFSKQGMKGADAGVSLNRMIDNLVRPKNLDAAALFKQLGISAFDANGELKPIPDMLDSINQALGGLSEQEQLELVSKLFGAESADVVLRALFGAGQGIRDMNADITQSGIAATQAEQRMDNWRGDLETLSGSINAAGLNITSAFLPALRSITQFATNAVDAFNGLPAPLQAVVVGLLAVGSAAIAGLGAGMLILPKVVEFTSALSKLGGVSGIVSQALTKLPIGLGPISIALAAGALAVAAYQNNWLGFRDIVDSVAQVLSGVLRGAVEGAVQFMDLLGDSVQQLSDYAQDSIRQLKTWADMFARMNDTFTAISQKSTGAGRAIDGFGQALKATTGIDLTGFFSRVADAIDGIVEKFHALKEVGGDAFSGATTSIAAAAPALVDAASAVTSALGAIKDAFASFSLSDLPFGPAEAAIVALSASMFAIVPVAQKFIAVMREVMTLQSLSGVLSNLKGGFGSLLGAINPVSVAFAGATLAIGALILAWQDGVRATKELDAAMAALNETINGVETSQLRNDFRELIVTLTDLEGMPIANEGFDNLFKDSRDYVRDYTLALNRIPDAAQAAGTSLDFMMDFMQYQDDLLRSGVIRLEELTEQYHMMNDIMTSTAPNADLLNQELERQMQSMMSGATSREEFMTWLRSAAADSGAMSDALAENITWVDATNIGAMAAARSLEGQSAASRELAEATAELTDHQKELISSYREALTPAVEGFTGAVTMFLPAGETLLNILAQMGDGQGIGNFVAGLDASARALNSVLGTMGQIEALGQSLGAAQQVAQQLVGDPGVYAVVDDLLAKGLITREELIAAQADEIRVVQANTAAQDALNTMRLAQMDALANTSEEYAAYLVTLSKLPAAEQAHALAMLDAGNQAKVAAAYSAAYSAQLGEIPQDIATEIIANSARADPVLAGLLEDYGLIKQGANGEITVTFPDASQEALDRFKQVFEGAQVTTKEGLIEVRQSDGTTLVYDSFNNLVAQSGTIIPATIEVDTSYAGYGGPRDVGPSAQQSPVTDIVKNLAEEAKSADYTPVTTAINEGITEAVSKVNPTTTGLDFAAFATSIVTSVATSITDASGEEITTALNTMVTDAVTAASTTSADASKIGSDLVTNAAKGITDKKADFDTAAKTMVTDAVKSANTEAATADTVGIEFVAQAKNGLTNDDDTFVTAGTDMVSTAVTDAKGKAAEALSIGQEFVAQGTSGITSDGGDFSTQGQTMVSDAVTNAKTKAADAIQVGQEFVAKAAQGITDSADQLRQAGEDAGRMLGEGAIAGINGMVGAVMTAANNLGAMAAQGITNGINAGLASISGAAGQIPGAITEPVQSGMLMESPSKLMHQFGLYVDEGLANGIEEGTGFIADAVRAMIAQIAGVVADRLGSFGDAFNDGGKRAGKELTAGVNETTDLADLQVNSPEWHAALHDHIVSSFTETGAKAGKGFIDAVDESTEDITFGSDEWYAALHDNILGHFGETGKQSGKKLKDEFDAETVDILGGLEDVLHDANIFRNLSDDLKRANAGMEELVAQSQGVEGIANAWLGVDAAITESGNSSNELGEMLGILADRLTSLGDSTGNSALTDLGQQFRDLSDEAFASGLRVKDGFIDKVMELGAELPGVLDASGAAFGRFGQMSTDQVTKAMAVMLDEIKGILTELIKVVREAFGMAAKEGTDAFADACYPGLKDAMAGAGDVIQTGAKDWESALITTGEWAGQTIGEAMANGMSQKEADWLNQMGFVVDLAIKKGVEGGKKGGSIGEETVKQAGEGVRRREGDYQQRMTEMVSKGADAGKAAATEFTDVGVAAVGATTKGMQSEQTDLLKAAETTVKALLKTFGDRVQAFYDIGKNFAEGLALGMRAGAGDVQTAANDLGKSAEKELRKATESASPSKAAFRVGQDVGSGFAGGISAGEEMTKKAARQLWRAAWKELKDNIREAGFLGSQWAVDFWQGMLNAPDMTGPLAAWITDQMVAAAKGALAKIRAEIAGIAAQLDIARNMPDPESMFPEVPRPEVPQPEPVDTSARDAIQAQLEATRDLTAAIEKAFQQAFSAAHKAHIDFVQGTISEEAYLSKYQAAQNAYNAKKANAEKIESLETQLKAAEAAIKAEEAARKAAYDQAVADAEKAYQDAVKVRDAQVAAERERQQQAIKELEQAQRDAQMEMTQAVIDEANKRIAQYQKELSKTNDPQQKAELKAKIALEKERIDVANQLAVAIDKANNASSDFDLATANAQIEFLTAQLEALEQVDVGGMLQGIADAIMEAGDKMAQAADKIKNAFRGGGKGGGKKDTGDKGTQDASDPGLSSGGMGAGMGGGGDDFASHFDKVGKAAIKSGNDVQTGMGVADAAIRAVLGTTLPEYVKSMGDAGTRGGKALGDNTSIAVASGQVHMKKVIETSYEGATVNGEKIMGDAGKRAVTEWTTNIETGAVEKTKDVTKTLDGVVTEGTKTAENTMKKGGEASGTTFITFTTQHITLGQNQVVNAARQAMQQAGQQASQTAQTEGRKAGGDLSKFAANGIDSGRGDVKRAGKQIMDDAGAEAKRDAHRLGKAAGNDLGQGVADGIRDKTRDVEQAARDLARAADQAGRDQSKSKSPSLVWKAHGHDMADGLILGLLDRVGEARDAARAVVYTPQGLPGGGLRAPGGNAQRGAGQGGGSITVNFTGPVNLPNVRRPQDFWPEVENLMRTHGVSSGR